MTTQLILRKWQEPLRPDFMKAAPYVTVLIAATLTCCGESPQSELAAKPAKEGAAATTAQPRAPATPTKSQPLADSEKESELLEKISLAKYGEDYRLASILLAKFYAANNPVKGIEWINSLEVSPEQQPLVGVFAHELSLIDPGMASTLGISIKSDGLRQIYFNAALRCIALKNPELSLGFLKDHENSIPNATSALGQILQAAAQSSGIGKSWSFLEDSFVKNDREAALKIIFRYGAAFNVKEILPYVDKLVDVGEKASAVQQIFVGIPEAQLTEASALLNEIPSGKVKDAGIVSLIDRIIHFSPRDAMTWAKVIADQETRELEIKTIIETANSFDPKLGSELSQ